MPEIWLRYGTTDVVLDIKFDNLSSQISSPLQPIPEGDVKAAVDGVSLSDNAMILALSPSMSVARVVLMLVEAARSKNFSFTVDVPARSASALRANLTSLPGGESVPINRAAQGQPLHERLAKFQSAVAVSTTSYDPLFGFAGGPTALLRYFLSDRMAEAFGARAEDNLPSPGEDGNPLKVAMESAAASGVASVELVSSSSGIAGFHTGTLSEAFGKAMSQLKSSSVVEEEPVKCAVMSASGEPAVQSTLSGSLNSLWNNIHIVREGGVAVLLAECREGLGGGALQMYVEGRLKPEQVAQSPYVEGLEHILFADALRKKYDLGLVSTLPRYYATAKLGFTAYSGMSDIMQKLPEKLGKSYRAMVLSDADITLLRPKI
jgi:hypothetical protein